MNTLLRPKAGRAEAELSRVLRLNRVSVARVFAEAFELCERWKVSAQASDSGENASTQFEAFADYLIQYFVRGDATFKRLFVGESIKCLYDPSLDSAEARSLAIAVSEKQRAGLCQLLSAQLSANALSLLESNLLDIQRTLTTEAATVQRVLLVGDCLFLDIVPFIVGDLLEAGITFTPDYASSKNTADLHRQLHELSAKTFDLVFFSPFTYEFSTAYTQLARWRQALTNEDDIKECVSAVWDETKATARCIPFDAPAEDGVCVRCTRPGIGKRLIFAKAY